MTTAIDTTKIRDLNDALRRTGVGGRMLLTAGIGALPVQHQVEILMRVRAHDEFTEDNDPHGEHDFGSFDHAGARIFWKIDYYDAACRYGSEDPADPAKTVRVLTVMLAEEY